MATPGDTKRRGAAAYKRGRESAFTEVLDMITKYRKEIQRASDISGPYKRASDTALHTLFHNIDKVVKQEQPNAKDLHPGDK